jgi:hypothetical protein
MNRRCYSCDEAEAAYEAQLNYVLTPLFLLCEECAIRERAFGDVKWIRTLNRSRP